MQEKAANPRLVESILRQIYYDPRHPAGFSSVHKLYQAARKRIKNLQTADVKKWLASQSTYVLHKSVKLRFPRRKVLVRGPKYQFQADLMDLQNRKCCDGICEYSRMFDINTLDSNLENLMVCATKNARPFTQFMNISHKKFF